MFLKIGENFSINHLVDFDKLELLPEIIHEYGSGFDNIPADVLCWMTYKLDSGQISFSRNTHLFCPEVVDYTVTYLNRLFNIRFLPERVHFLRTNRSIGMHRDESGRKSCINIGLKNSNSAKTFISDGTEQNYENECQEFCVNDGSAYLLDTSKLHSVEGSHINRYMITYGFGSTFDEVSSRLILDK